MLLRQHCRRDEHRDLTTAVDGFEDRPHGDFRLAETHVAADQTIHGFRLLHILFQIRDGCDLIDGFGERECFVEFLLQMRIRGALKSRPRCPLGLQFQHVGGHVGNGFGNLIFFLQPRRAAVFCEFGRCLGRADIFLDQMNQ